MSQAYIGLGSNLNNPELQLQCAVDALAGMGCSHLRGVSSIYQSQPLGSLSQPDYCNAVVLVETQLAPLSLLDQLQAIETMRGRVREGVRWGPRVIDLDLLLFDSQVIVTERLTVPHYDLINRAFVLYPLVELDPDCRLPNGRGIKEVCREVSTAGLRRLTTLLKGVEP